MLCVEREEGINKERVLKFPLCKFICTALIGINKYAVNKH